MSLLLGDILLPFPMTLETAKALSLSISGKVLNEIMANASSQRQASIPSAIFSEQLQVDSLSAFLLYGIYTSGKGAAVRFGDVAQMLQSPPDLSAYSFLSTMQMATKGLADLRTYHYPLMPFINEIRQIWGGLEPAESVTLTHALPAFMHIMAMLSVESEAQAANAIPFLEVLIARHPELTRANYKVYRAFASSAGRDDLVDEPAEAEPSISKSDVMRSNLCSEVLGPEDSATATESGWLLYDKNEIRTALKAFSKPGSSASPLGMLGEQQSPRQQLLMRMLNSPAKREIVQQPATDDLFKKLADRFPHFSPVVEHLQRHLALHGCGNAGAPVQFPPILLIGEPGIGKTFFGQYLAELLNVHFLERDLSVVTDAMVITGGSSTWKDSSPGIVFQSLMNQNAANPLILLNEIDKCSDGGRSYRNPLSSLYALLEKRSASAWADEFAAVPIDASRVNWIMTANDGFIPEPIRDRADVFVVRNPTKEESMRVAAFIWRDLVEKDFPKGHNFEPLLSESVLEYGVTLPSRKLKKLLTSAAGNAILANRNTLTVEDLAAVCGNDDIGGQRLGFL